MCSEIIVCDADDSTGWDWSSWGEAIVLLSLDAIVPFAHELGLEKIDLAPLREIARDALKKTDCIEYDRYNPRNLASVFRKRVSEKLGKEVLGFVETWFSETFPDRKTAECLLPVKNAFRILVKKWNKAEDIAPLPLGSADCTHYRLLIRNVVSRQDNISFETDLLGNFSPWDSMMEEMRDYSFSVSSFLYRALYIRAYFGALTELRNNFPTEETARFTQWWHDCHMQADCLRLILPDGDNEGTT